MLLGFKSHRKVALLFKIRLPVCIFYSFVCGLCFIFVKYHICGGILLNAHDNPNSIILYGAVQSLRMRARNTSINNSIFYRT